MPDIKDTWSSNDSNVIGDSLKNALYFIYRNETTGEILTQDMVKFIVNNSSSYFTDEAYSYSDGQWLDVKLESEVKIAEPTDIELLTEDKN